MSKTFRPFPCAECGGGLVDYRSGPGRTYDYAEGYELPIPADFLIPTCGTCGEQYFTQALTERLVATLREAFLRSQASHYRQLVDTLASRHCVTQKDIVRACGITRGSKGRSPVNPPLYPKTYATVLALHLEARHPYLEAKTDAGERVSLLLRWRCGRGSTCSFGKGTRIKLYQRPHVTHPNFRRVGA